MTSWLEKAKAHFAKPCQRTAPKTTKTEVMGVLVAPSLPIFENYTCTAVAEQALLRELLAEADHVCKCWGDDDAAREQMHREVMELAKDQWRDLLAYFRSEYPR